VTRSEQPGATLVWALLAGAMVWFAGRLWALRGIAAYDLDTQGAAGLVIFALPGLVSAALVLGAGTGLGLVSWQGMAGRPGKTRTGYGAAGGLAAAAFTGGALFASGGPHPMAAAAVSVAVAALLGGLLAGLRTRVLAAGLAGALGVAAVQLLAALFASPLRRLLDGSGTGPEVADAELQLAMIIGLVSGIAAGLAGYAVLRRMRPVGLSGYLAAGGMAGGLLLAAEMITRLAVPPLLDLAGGRTGDDPLVLQLTGQARLNAGLLVFFAGAITSLVALGRGMPRRPAPSPGVAQSADSPIPARSANDAPATDEPVAEGS
jgi:hypothetical protein